MIPIAFVWVTDGNEARALLDLAKVITVESDIAEGSWVRTVDGCRTWYRETPEQIATLILRLLGVSTIPRYQPEDEPDNTRGA